MRVTRLSMKNPRRHRRAEAWDPWEGRTFAIVPDTLRPGIDRVKLMGAHLKLRSGRSSAGLYFGHYQDRASVLFDGELIPRLVPAWALLETGPVSSSLDAEEFRDGFWMGTDLCERMAPIATKSQNRVPTDHNRGVVAGHRVMCERRHLVTWVEAYNECARELALRYPKEHWVGAP